MSLPTPTPTQILTFPDVAALSQGLAKYVAKLSNESIKRHGKFTIALSGGSLPKQLADIAKNHTIDFAHWHVFFADERCVPLDHEDSNYLLAKTNLFDLVPSLPREQIYTIDPDLVDDPAEAAEDYISQLAKVFATKDSVRFPVFDLILLGVGPDGHTCSLFPGHELLQERTAWCASISDSPKPPSSRITLTLPVVNHAHHIAFVAAGAGKQDMLHQILDTHGDLPAQLVHPTATGTLSWFLDNAAAAKITSTTYKGLERL
ncbi:suppressor of los1-1 [Gryganskiella cystojenkinii]|nr:suppressor of los1-1 [Gryganskiella cystojenkinii]